MWPSESMTILDDQPGHEREQKSQSMAHRFGLRAVVAALIAFAPLADLLHNARAGTVAQASSKNQVTATADSTVPLAESREQFRRLQTQLFELGAQVLGRAAPPNQISDAIINQQITVKSAEANYENAKLTREVAEIAVVEYTEGIYKQDLATLQGELKVAELGPPRAEDWVEAIKDRLAKTRQASIGSAPELAYEYGLEKTIAEIELRVPRRRLELANAQAKLDCFLSFAKSRREKELKAKVETARCEELAAQAVWERAKFKLKTLQEAVKHTDQEVHSQRVLTLLQAAVPIVEDLRIKLAQAEKDPQSNTPIRVEITTLTAQLHGLVELAQREVAAAQWAKVKPKLRSAAARFLGATAK